MLDPKVDVVLTRIGALADDIGEMRAALKELAHSFAKLALIEERQTQANEALGRVFKAIDKTEARALAAEAKAETRTAALESRISSLEREMPLIRQSSGWVTSSVSAAATAAVLYIAKKIGIIS